MPATLSRVIAGNPSSVFPTALSSVFPTALSPVHPPNLSPVIPAKAGIQKKPCRSRKHTENKTLRVRYERCSGACLCRVTIHRRFFLDSGLRRNDGGVRAE